MIKLIPRMALTLLGACSLLAGCALSPPPLVQGPLQVAPLQQPLYIERPSNGAIYQAHMSQGSLFSGEKRPQAIGDRLKVNISESLQAKQQLATDTSRDNKLAVKGPGTSGNKSGFLESLLNANASASGSDSYKGSGKTDLQTSFEAQLAVTVINVLSNGHLVVAGERRTGLNGDAQTLRFSGVVDPRDIRPGNTVSSADVANATLESAGQGDVSDAASRSWLQRVMARSLAIW